MTTETPDYVVFQSELEKFLSKYLPVDGSGKMTGNFKIDDYLTLTCTENRSYFYTKDSAGKSTVLETLSPGGIDDISRLIEIRVTDSGSPYFGAYKIFGEHNITCGTSDITAGTSALATGCYYDVYK